MESNYTPKNEIDKRIKKLQDRLSKEDIDAALIIQKADLFYFAGTCQNAHLIVPAEGQAVLMAKKSVERAQQESPLDKIVKLKNLKELASIMKDYKRIGMELDVLPTAMYYYYKKILSSAEILDLSDIIRKIRMIKSEYEIGLMKETAELNSILFSEASRIIRPGMTEIEVAGELESIYRKNGHQGAIRMRGFNQEIFYGHLMSGENASFPSFFNGPTGGPGLNPSFPQSAGYKKIRENEPILIDYVGARDGYIVDQARIFVIGSLSDKLMQAHDVAVGIKNRLAKSAITGASGKDLFEIAEKLAVESGFGDYFMGHDDKINFVGHGVGIELDEYPVIARNFDMPLEPGMVFALEPKFIFPGEGVVGIEDTFVLTENGLEQITYFDDAVQKI
jgi:Xaa-Pro aminopeptidase